MVKIGLISPGTMGSAIAACAASKGHEILWASDGRSPASVQRAERYGFQDVGTFEVLAQEVQHILCCGTGVGKEPFKHWAFETAEEIVAAGFQGTYCDANSMTEEMSSGLAQILDSPGIDYVNGMILGSPPTSPEMSVRGYIQGDMAQAFSELFNQPDVPKMLKDGILEYRGDHDDYHVRGFHLRSRKERGLLGRQDVFNWVVVEGDPMVLKLAFTAYTSVAHGAIIMANRFAREHNLEEHLFFELTNGFPIDAAMDGSRMGVFAGW
jgi:hypothetical protein